MTWHHVAALLIATAMVIACGTSTTCAVSFPAVVQLATVIVAGTFGHAGAQIRSTKKSDHHENQDGK
jgi:hypothetical protein